MTVAMLAVDSAVDPGDALASCGGAAVSDHGTISRYRGTKAVEGCRCDPCRAANAAYSAQARREPSKRVPVGTIRTHVAELRAAGMTLSEIADRADVKLPVLWKIVEGKQNRCTRATRRQILGVMATFENHISVVPSLSFADDVEEPVAVDVLAVLRLLITPDELAWKGDGSCAHLDMDLATVQEMFFPKRGEDTTEAQAICRGDVTRVECPCREQCLQFALDTNTSVGIWGGTTGQDRRVMKATT